MFEHVVKGGKKWELHLELTTDIQCKKSKGAISNYSCGPCTTLVEPKFFQDLFCTGQQQL